MPFGSLRTNQTAPFVERHIYATWSGVGIGQGTTWRPHMYDFTMPFDGYIMVDCWVQVTYGSPASVCACTMVMATPLGPTNHWAGYKLEFNQYGGIMCVPAFGYWANLTAGTYFDLTVEIQANAINGTMGIERFDGFLRAVAT